MFATGVNKMTKGLTQKLISQNAAELIAAGIDSGEFEVELILCHLLKIDRLKLYLDGDKLIDDKIEKQFYEMLARRKTRYPIQYILNEAWFYGRPFYVDESVMIPTPETEQVCLTAISFLENFDNPEVLDIGTGSGVIAVTLAAESKNCSIVATDINADSLKTATRNALAFEVAGRIEFRQSDLFVKMKAGEKFDLIISNPPYISEDDFPTLPPEVKADPKIALTAGPDGLNIIRRILYEAPNYLNQNGRIMLEIGYNQSEAISGLVEEDNRFKSLNILQDLNGIDRTVILACDN